MTSENVRGWESFKNNQKTWILEDSETKGHLNVYRLFEITHQTVSAQG